MEDPASEMSPFGDRKGEVTDSEKTCKSVQAERSRSPSFQSFKSEKSIPEPMNFKNDQFPAGQRKEIVVQPKSSVDGPQPERSVSSVPSYTSMKSCSMQQKSAVSPGSSSIPCCEDQPLMGYRQKLISHLKKKSEYLFEGIAKHGSPTLLNDIYTELYVTEGGTGGISDEHEVIHIERSLKKPPLPETTIKCKDIFTPLHGKVAHTRTVLTQGIAGIGKTVSVQKFILDWAEGKENQEVNFVFPLPFRDLNLLKNKEFSLTQLVHYFLPEVKEFGLTQLFNSKVLFVFDGLDECRLPLDFKNNEICFDVTETTSLDILLTSLLKGKLFPSALIWITSRPAAASQIPPECVDRVTEIRGFSDPQKEEYFRKRFNDEDLANRIITHVKSSRSLYIMCHIPVFCWISATVLERLFVEEHSGEIPKTLTEMYTHFLIFQTHLKNEKYLKKQITEPLKSLELDKEFVLKLGKMAFNNLTRGHLIFYEEDLREFGIDVSEASVYSGMCTEVFRQEFGLYEGKIYCFVHLSVQEYLAALHKFLSNTDSTLLKETVDQALESKNGHLDLYLCFLLGLSVEHSQKLLKGLMTQTKSCQIKEVIKHIRQKIHENLSPEKTIYLFHCLNELKDNSLVMEVQSYLNSGRLSEKNIGPTEWSALAFVLLMSAEELDGLDLRNCTLRDEGLRRMQPVIQLSRTALLNNCSLTVGCCEVLVSVLSSNLNLRVLDLSDNNLQDSGVELLSAGLGNQHCKLDTLRLCNCRLTEGGCAPLASAVRLNPSHLRELDLSYNHPGDSGAKLLSDILQDPTCRLKTLRLKLCGLTEKCCEALASVLSSNSSHLRELELSDNDLKDSGVELLSTGLRNQHCKLNTLRLSGCCVTEGGCASLASALRSNPSNLRELDLSYNHPGDSGVKLLSDLLQDPTCKLETLNVDHGGECRVRPRLLKYSCQLTLDPNTANTHLCLSEGNRVVTWNKEELQPYSPHADRFDCCSQVLCVQDLSGRFYWEVQWSGKKARIGVTYKGISRKRDDEECWLGYNNKSWSLCCFGGRYSVKHNKKQTVIPVPPFHTVGVYLDWPAGTVSFYRITHGELTLLYRFTSTFTEPLYPGFLVWDQISLCELGHEDTLT